MAEHGVISLRQGDELYRFNSDPKKHFYLLRVTKAGASADRACGFTGYGRLEGNAQGEPSGL